MSGIVRLLLTVSRPEFIPANSASLIIGLSWGIKLPVDLFWGVLIPVVFVFVIISLVAAIAAQINTMADHELDMTDSRKNELVKAIRSVGRNKVKMLVVFELLICFPFILFLWSSEGKPLLLFMWVFAVFLAYAYSSPPLRLKSRSWLAVLTLIIVLSILPVSFVYHVFTSELDSLFFLFLSGQALTVYGVIMPAEIRDYFRDQSMAVQTMTVQLGLVNASILSIILLSMGGLLVGTGIFIKLLYGSQPLLAVAVVVMAVVYAFILKKYKRLYFLSKKYVASESSGSGVQEIEDLAAQNPKWITIITQMIVLMCVVLLVSKFLY